jgi:hypothetical protein
LKAQQEFEVYDQISKKKAADAERERHESKLRTFSPMPEASDTRCGISSNVYGSAVLAIW